MVTAWNNSELELVSHSLGDFSLTTHFRALASDLSLTVTNVYGPCDHSRKHSFLDELSSITSRTTGAWTIVGDYNLTRFPSDKSNDNFDLNEAHLFNSTIDNLGLLEIPLLD